MSLLVATDLDGCLLDEATYRYDAARAALARLREERVPLILASSKTRTEMEPLVAELDLDSPFIVENGGAIVMPEGYFPNAGTNSRHEGRFRIHVLGTPRAALVAALHEIARASGVGLRGMAAMTIDEIRERTGLAEKEALRAQAREFDEPFAVQDDGDLDRVREAAARRGMRVARGGRFHHLTGDNDKGCALATLVDLYRAAGRIFTVIALGDSANDLSLLRTADRAVVVPRPSGEIAAELRAALPHAERAPLPGPLGWNRAMMTILDGRRLDSVGGHVGGGEGQ